MKSATGDAKSGSLVYLTLTVLVATLGGLLFGYDTAVISGAIGFLEQHFLLSATMKGWAASSALIGCVIGVAMAGEMNDRLGRRTTLLVAAVLFLISAIGTALPRRLTEFIVFRIIGGLGVGAASMTSPMYIAEISPARIRGRGIRQVQRSNQAAEEHGGEGEARRVGRQAILHGSLLMNTMHCARIDASPPDYWLIFP